MTTITLASDNSGRDSLPAVAALFRRGAIAVYILALAWAPFPLGSAVSWGASVLQIMIGISWVLWAVSIALRRDRIELFQAIRKNRVPSLLVALVLLWIFLQTVPLGWSAHPIWKMTSDLLNRPVAGTISIDPWRTTTQLLKLIFEVAAFWLSLCFASRADTAKLLLNAALIIVTLYAVYALVLVFLHTSQASLVYGIPIQPLDISGPFMQRNSFATFCGMGALAAIAGFFDKGSRQIISDRGVRQFSLSVLQFAFGPGAILLVSFLLLFGTVIATGSRAGSVSTLVALFVFALVIAVGMRKSSGRHWRLGTALLGCASLIILLIANADVLQSRLLEFVDAGTFDSVRLALWQAAERMISVFPGTGLGLGTFEDAYPMFATQVLPFVMDKAHCAYLEFAAGVGIPAAILWWVAMAWLVVKCFRGAITRKRNQSFPAVAFGATVLVGLHSTVDFSLQLPAVALLYVTFLAIGVAQSERSRKPATRAAEAE